MALNDVRIRESAGGTTRVMQVQDRTSSSAAATIKAGEPVKFAADGSPYVILVEDGEPVIAEDLFVGIAVAESTETATADGTVEVFIPQPGQTLLECAPTTAANADTQAEIDALVGDAVTFDLSNGVFTVDENEGNDDNAHGLVIEGGDATRGVLYFSIKDSVTKRGSLL